VAAHSEKLLPNNGVDFLLRRQPRADAIAEGAQLFRGRVFEIAQVGRIDLRMPAELAKVGVEQRGVKKEGQSARQRQIQTASVAVKVVEMVFQSQVIAR